LKYLCCVTSTEERYEKNNAFRFAWSIFGNLDILTLQSFLADLTEELQSHKRLA